MATLASIVLNPATIGTWVILGVFSGWLAGKVMNEASYGRIGDLVVGSAGGLCGGVLLWYFNEGAEFWFSTLVAFIGACVLIAVARMLAAYRNA